LLQLKKRRSGDKMFFDGKSSDVTVFDKSDISELEDLLLVNGELQIVSSEELNDFTQNQISQFCVENGFYTIPTLELISFLHNEIGENNFLKTLEIGAGHGAISRELKIRAVDNYMQLKPEVRAIYDTLEQTIVPYGKHVEEIDGNEAIKKYKPKIVIGAFCTHKYNAKEHWRGGNVWGLNEKLILERVDKYIHIGNRSTHSKKPILKYKHREVKEDWIITRSFKPKENVIWIWEK
jgi:hypothetical protein